jgi:hypothetical protein
MTTLTLNIKDDRKVEDVLRFLRDIDFLEVSKTHEPRPEKKVVRSLFGSLKKFSNPDGIQKESSAWYHATRKKHDSN